MFKYPARFEADPDGGFTVTFRDIPEAPTQGDTLGEAEEAARDALITAMDFYFDDKRKVPEPSVARKGEVLVELPASLATKVLLLNAMIDDKVRPADLARAMGIKPQEVNRLVDIHHASKIDSVAAAFRALGKELSFTVRPLKQS